MRWDGGRGGGYDVATGRPIRELASLSGSSEERSVALDPDGSRLAAVGPGHSIYLYAVSGNDVPPKLLGSHRDQVTSLRFHPDGSRLVSTSTDCTARLFDLSGGGDPITLLGHSASIKAAAFSPDGRLLATAANDHTVRIWDTGTGQCLMVLRNESAVLSVAFSPDGGYLAAGTGAGGMDRRKLSSTGSRIAGPGKSLAATATGSTAWLFIRTGGRSFRRRPIGP